LRNIIIISSFLLITLNGFGQESKEITDTSKIHFGTLEDNFIGGRNSYYNTLKIEYPYHRRKEGVVGNVWFEIEVDTNSQIINFKIIRGVVDWMDKEVEEKIYLTNGHWKSPIVEGEKVNFIYRNKVYFELR
jgi:hypothetical protein